MVHEPPDAFLNIGVVAVKHLELVDIHRNFAEVYIPARESEVPFSRPVSNTASTRQAPSSVVDILWRLDSPTPTNARPQTTRDTPQPTPSVEL